MAHTVWAVADIFAWSIIWKLKNCYRTIVKTRENKAKLRQSETKIDRHFPLETFQTLTGMVAYTERDGCVQNVQPVPLCELISLTREQTILSALHVNIPNGEEHQDLCGKSRRTTRPVHKSTVQKLAIQSSALKVQLNGSIVEAFAIVSFRTHSTRSVLFRRPFEWSEKEFSGFSNRSSLSTELALVGTYGKNSIIDQNADQRCKDEHTA